MGLSKTADQFQPDDDLAGTRRRHDVVLVIALDLAFHYLQDHLLVLAEGMAEMESGENRDGGGLTEGIC